MIRTHTNVPIAPNQDKQRRIEKRFGLSVDVPRKELEQGRLVIELHDDEDDQGMNHAAGRITVVTSSGRTYGAGDDEYGPLYHLHETEFRRDLEQHWANLWPVQDTRENLVAILAAEDKSPEWLRERAHRRLPEADG